jgi:prophage antirepressor-like protein
MNELMVFNNPEFGEIRTVEVGGEPWLVGLDAAQALGYQNGSRDINRHVDEEDRKSISIYDGTQNRTMTIINESGLYSLVLSSKLPGAKKFRRWVTSEVLPSIRKTGRYTAKPMTDYQQMMAETRRSNARVQAARILTQLAKQYHGTTYEQVLNAHATKELTGDYLLPLPKLEAKTYSAAQIGELLGISANKVGNLANRNHLKTDQYGQWFKDKAPKINKEVPCFRYYETVIPVLRDLLQAETA